MNAGTWRRKAELAWVGGVDRVHIVDLDQPDNPPLLLTESAASIWLAVDDGRTTEDIAVAVATTYGEPVEMVQPAVETFMVDLSRRGLVVRD